MTVHFHGTPITPAHRLALLGGECFCVSFAAPANVAVCHEIGQSVMLDNGAFSVWQKVLEGKPIPDRLRAAADGDWSGYYQWAEPWLQTWTTWAVVPDVIDGTEDDNDALIEEWPHGKQQAAPVWHMHESIDRLVRLCGEGWSRVCVGSSGAYAKLNTPQWHHRMQAAMNAACPDGRPLAPLHMLRGMAQSFGPYPFASVDSTDVAQNHHLYADILSMARRWDAQQCPATWTPREQLEMVA